MQIGLTYDLRADYLAAGYGDEETAEFDQLETVDGIDRALCELGLGEVDDYLTRHPFTRRIRTFEVGRSPGRRQRRQPLDAVADGGERLSRYPSEHGPDDRVIT